MFHHQVAQAIVRRKYILMQYVVDNALAVRIEYLSVFEDLLCWVAYIAAFASCLQFDLVVNILSTR